jgi:hypothetical protein
MKKLTSKSNQLQSAALAEMPHAKFFEEASAQKIVPNPTFAKVDTHH